MKVYENRVQERPNKQFVFCQFHCAISPTTYREQRTIHESLTKDMPHFMSHQVDLNMVVGKGRNKEIRNDIVVTGTDVHAHG